MSRRRMYWVAGMLILLAGLLLYAAMGARQVSEVRRSLTDAQPAVEGNVDLALSGVRLKQGEKGRELWTLEAEKAFYDQQGDTVRIKQPDIVYFLEKQNDNLSVKARWGEIKQSSQSMRLWDDVVLVQTDKMLKTSLLTYLGSSRELTMPEKVWFETGAMNGTMHDVLWLLDTNVIKARGSVDMVLYLEDGFSGLARGEKRHEQN
ncbi:LPS export ABC transporter periplasmic protein LptC [Oleidesulfovibrio alaskensis]